MSDGSVTKGCLGTFMGISTFFIVVFVVIPVLCIGGCLYGLKKTTDAANVEKAGKDADAKAAAGEPRTVPQQPLSKAPVASDAARARALVYYPAVGKAGSPLNVEFLRRYNLYQKEKPDFFSDPDWPLKLAAECSRP